jgi:hypothetical protein
VNHSKLPNPGRNKTGSIPYWIEIKEMHTGSTQNRVEFTGPNKKNSEHRKKSIFRSAGTQSNQQKEKSLTSGWS